MTMVKDYAIVDIEIPCVLCGHSERHCIVYESDEIEMIWECL